MKKTLKLKIWNIKEYVNYTTTNKQTKKKNLMKDFFFK